MRFITLFVLLVASLSASAPGVTDPTVPGSPPVMMRHFSSTALVQIQTPAPPSLFRSAATTATSTSPPLAMKILVIDGETTETSYQSITAFLSQIGVPYDAVVLSSITPDAAGNRLDGLTLSTASGQGVYQGIILTDSTFGVCNPTCVSLLSTSDWSKLDTYAAQFNVRMVSYFTWPEARWGLVAMDAGASYSPSNAVQASLTSAGASVFPYLNSANPIPVAGNDYGGIWAYMATTTAATGETTTSLLTVGSYTIAALHTTAAGEQTLALTFDNFPTLLHSEALSYGIINWMTNGVFLGSRQIYLSPQIDDLLIGDRLYAPTLPQCPSADTCPTIRTSETDMYALSAWQQGVQQTAQFQNYRNTFAYVGIGTTSEYSPPGDPLLTSVTALGSEFGWVSHTYSHSNLDCYTTTNGNCNPATLAQSLSELQQNIAVAGTLEITIDRTGIVTPYNSGLSNANFLTAALEEGIQSVIYPGASPTPNTGIVDSTNPAILEVPRLYTNLFDDVDSPQPGAYGSWPDEYNAEYGPNGTNPTFTTNQSYSQILDNESDNVLLLNMLTDQLTPLGFHICDIYAYDGVHSLYTDLMNATIAKYDALFNLPVITLTMAEMNPLLQARASYNASGVSGVYTPGVSVVLTTVNAGTIPVTGACAQATCPTYGGQIQDSIAMAANSTVTLYLTAGQGVAIASLAVNPSTVTGGTAATGTVTLSGPAPAGGISVGLSSNSSSATVPSSVLINAGTLSANFAVSTAAVSSSTTVTLTASYAGVSRTASLTINPVAVALASVSLNPTSVTGGNPSTGTVTLSGPAPSGGISVALSSNNASAIVTTPVTVNAGLTSATFTVTTKAVTSSTNAVITATYNGVNQTASLTINPVAAALASVSLNPTSVTGGNPSTGTVTLSGPAPTGGISVALSSNNASAIVTTPVTVNAGLTSATFTVTTKAVTSSTTAVITATYNGVNQTASLTINPVAVALASVSLNPTSVTGGNPSTGTVTLSGPAPTGGISVALSSNNASAIVTTPVTVNAGLTSATFTVTTKAVTSSTTATITATYSSVNQTASLTINPVAVTLASVSLNPTSVTGGNPSTGTVTLSGPAPSGGISVTLSSNDSAASVPDSVVVAAGYSTANFTVNTRYVSFTTLATITANFGGTTMTARLTIDPRHRRFDLRP
jgi:hypothetical protein